MKIIKLDPYAVTDIQNQVDKILNGLGNPEPPLNLDDVRELLKLDLQYYSSDNTRFLSEIVSKIKVGVKQLAKRPSLILDVINKAELKALWLPDRKRILIDEAVPDLKKRHVEAHEIIHSITPHHAPYFLGDDVITLQNSCHEKLEAEANYGSGQLLFLRDKFLNISRDYPREMSTVKKLSKMFGNTLTMTLWRLIESAHIDEALFGTIGPHPLYTDENFDNNNPFRYFIASPAFYTRFSNINSSEVFKAMLDYVKPRKSGPLGKGEILIYDLDGQCHCFHMETFHNSYEALTIGSYSGSVSNKIII